MKKKGIWIIGFVILFILVFASYFIYMKYFNGSIEEGNFCDAGKECSEELTCIKFPENEFPTCVTQEEIDNYVCPDGTDKYLFESKPLKLFCEIRED